MSRSRSTSLEIVPPANSRARGLAEVMDFAFKNNHNQDDDNSKDFDDPDADAEVDEIEDQATTQAANVSSNTPNAPTPCERCVRTSKQCKGVAGSRCEYCKRLKQKCSNSTGPARGKHASAKKAADSAGTTKTAANKATGPSGTPQTNSLKRKSSVKGGTPLNGDVDGHSLDGEGSVVDDDGHEPPARLNKKRRMSKGSGPSRAQLGKAANDMDAAIKRIQASVSKEVEKMNNIIKTLTTRIREMDEE